MVRHLKRSRLKHHLTHVLALLEDGAIVSIEQSFCASLVHREIAILEYAFPCVRIADWYVAYDGDHAIFSRQLDLSARAEVALLTTQ